MGNNQYILRMSFQQEIRAKNGNICRKEDILSIPINHTISAHRYVICNISIPVFNASLFSTFPLLDFSFSILNSKQGGVQCQASYYPVPGEAGEGMGSPQCSDIGTTRTCFE